MEKLNLATRVLKQRFNKSKVILEYDIARRKRGLPDSIRLQNLTELHNSVAITAGL